MCKLNSSYRQLSNFTVCRPLNLFSSNHFIHSKWPSNDLQMTAGTLSNHDCSRSKTIRTINETKWTKDWWNVLKLQKWNNEILSYDYVSKKSTAEYRMTQYLSRYLNAMFKTKGSETCELYAIWICISVCTIILLEVLSQR